ncbi:MAG: Gfo/Idh/MocA family oxidoreductase [Clostridia bacterium]|nr:Gfo/Idh/MocA family oxidoreductase [Clostridia bacterium]
MKNFRIGIVGSENFHAKEFTKFFNKGDENGDLIYPDCHVTLVYGNYPEENEALVKEFGADAVANSIEEMVENVDAVMITARDGRFHADFAIPFIEKGIPAFIDKPFTSDPAEALALVRLAKEKGVPLCGGSTVKYADGVKELKDIKNELAPTVHGGTAAAPLSFKNEYGDFWFYSSHLAEITMEIFGYGPRAVTARENNQSVCAIVDYEGFSVTCNFMEKSYTSYSASLFAEQKTEHRAISLGPVFRRGCDNFVNMIRSGKMPASYEELVAPVVFLDAVKRSYETGKTVEMKYERI